MDALQEKDEKEDENMEEAETRKRKAEIKPPRPQKPRCSRQPGNHGSPKMPSALRMMAEEIACSTQSPSHSTEPKREVQVGATDKWGHLEWPSCENILPNMTHFGTEKIPRQMSSKVAFSNTWTTCRNVAPGRATWRFLLWPTRWEERYRSCAMKKVVFGHSMRMTSRDLSIYFFWKQLATTNSWMAQ